jgi:hypothetical protein
MILTFLHLIQLSYSQSYLANHVQCVIDLGTKQKSDLSGVLYVFKEETAIIFWLVLNGKVTKITILLRKTYLILMT